MLCPKCDAEFVVGITRCSDCGVELVEPSPPGPTREERAEAFLEVPEGPLVRVPLGNASNAALVQSLLRSAGFPIHVNDGFGEGWDEVFVRADDLVAVKEFLKEYRSTRALTDDELPIQW